jgi:hypothetical protein
MSYVDYSKLPYVVQCKSSLPFFEDMAAFNVKSVAEHYMVSCAKVNPQFQYKLVTAKVRVDLSVSVC